MDYIVLLLAGLACVAWRIEQRRAERYRRQMLHWRAVAETAPLAIRTLTIVPREAVQFVIENGSVFSKN